MFSKNNPVVLLLDRSGFTLYQATLVNIVKFAFTPDIVANLEIVNREQFLALVSSFIDKSRIYPSIIFVLLEDAIVYEKDLSKVSQKAQPVAVNTTPLSSNQKIMDFANRGQEFKTEIQNFLQNIPFEDILAKVIKTETITRLVAVNKDLIFSTTEPFIKKGFLIEAIVPAFLYGQTVNFVNGLTLDTARFVLRKQELLKVANLLTDQQETTISQAPYEDEKEKRKQSKKNLRQLILIGAFVVLLIILGIMFVGLGGEKKNLKNNETKPSINKVTLSPTPIAIKSDLPIGSSSAILSIENVEVIIVQNSRTLAASGLLKEGLEEAGFKNIISENSTDTAPAKSSVLFSKNIPTNMRQNVILEINKIFSNVLVLEDENSDSKITIIIGQS